MGIRENFEKKYSKKMTHRLFRIIANDFDRTVLSMRRPVYHNIGRNPWRPIYRFNDLYDGSVFETNRHFANRADGKWNYDIALEADTKPDDIKINIEKNLLKISGTSKVENKFITGDKMVTNWEWSESIKLPQDVDANTINATFEKNKLTLSAAIIEEVSNPVQIPVTKK